MTDEELNARFDTLIASIEALTGRVGHLENKVDDLGDRTMRGLSQMNLRLNAVETRLAAVEVRISDGEASPEPFS